MEVFEGLPGNIWHGVGEGGLRYVVAIRKQLRYTPGPEISPV